MARAQRRNAVGSQKFYFRKDVFPPSSSRASSASSSSASSPVDGPSPCASCNGASAGLSARKEKKLRNCFPLAPKPEEDDYMSAAVEDEYEEMSMVEIMNGKVRCLRDAS